MTRLRMVWVLASLIVATVAGAESLCFKIGERVDGDKKVCIYQCRMKQATLTVAANQPCPKSIKH